jgi:hypothetical protein
MSCDCFHSHHNPNAQAAESYLNEVRSISPAQWQITFALHAYPVRPYHNPSVPEESTQMSPLRSPIIIP